MLPQANTGYDYYVSGVDIVLNGLLPTAIGFVVLLFAWGFMKYVWSWDHEKERERGKKLMLFGVSGLFVLMVVYGIVDAATGKIDTFLGTDETVVGENATSTDMVQ